MSQFYTPKRTRNIFDPASKKPFKLSRTKLELFLDCPRCFYLDRRLGVGQPPGYPFTLNSAVDALLKREFDLYRAKRERHPLMTQYGIDAIPAKHEFLDIWRENFKGVEFHHEETNLIITGALDDLWENSKKEYIVVDYKATSKDEKIDALDQEWHSTYKRQMEIYQWLLRQNGYIVTNVSYFLYCNGIKSKDVFHNCLEFDVTLIAYEGNDDWIEKVVYDAHKCLISDDLPEQGADCDFCKYRDAVSESLN